MAIAKDRVMGSAYNHLGVEERLYQEWETSGAFTPAVPAGGRAEIEPFTIVIPPPNITGALHHGSAMFVTLQDIMVRWRRMQGRRTLWLPGTDHAGIATQNVVERALASEGKTRFDLGREQFVERVWRWKEQYGSRITEQLKRMGASCDWTRERFTLDPGLSRAVREAFVRLYEQGLIYRGSYIVNWCPRCATVLSDIEVDHVEAQGSLWHVRYPVEGQPGRFVVVATTRPETMLGDTGVAVHPDDERYAGLIGQRLILPLVNRSIPIVGDDAVEREFGTGAVKVTPAHDPTDYEIGRRHALEMINVMNPDATINENGGVYQGLGRAEARQRVVSDLEAGGYMVKVQPHTHAIAQCSRCDTVLEPRISEQWWVKMPPLAAPAIEAVRDGRIKIVPERFTKMYFDWLENIRDWPISRQLWWGHRIPVWYCDDCGETIVAREDPSACPKCGHGSLRQDEDVLDTWFSAGLWPFSTLGWPEQTDDLRYFYPTSVLETGWDIIFFWVARMIMFGLEFMGEVPFETVYLHGMVRHEDGSKIEKSNYRPGDDPLDVIEQYGADALRFTLATGSTPGNDLRLSLERVAGNRNFANKLWNAARFVVSATEGIGLAPGLAVPAETLALSDRWIRSRVEATTAEVTRLLEAYNFGEAGRTLYDFTWSELCDWYIEIAKLGLRSNDAGRQRAVASTLHYVLKRTLALLHPYMPYVTEEIWRHLPEAVRGDRALLINAAWPQPGQRDGEAEARMQIVMDVIRAIRNARSEQRVEADRRVDAILVGAEAADLLLEQAAAISTLAKVGKLEVHATLPERPGQAIHLIAGPVEVSLPLAGMVDTAAETARLEAELRQAAEQQARIETLLANPAFVGRARPDVVERERARLAETRERQAKLEQQLADLR
ncbi:MAG TPA: valine--tRNA ligase [Chloroflexota bacterium]